MRKIQDEGARGAGTKVDEQELAHIFAGPGYGADHPLAKTRLETGVQDDEIGGGQVRDPGDPRRADRTFDRNRRRQRSGTREDADSQKTE